jgi:hypothetical protein
MPRFLSIEPPQALEHSHRNFVVPRASAESMAAWRQPVFRSGIARQFNDRRVRVQCAYRMRQMLRPDPEQAELDCPSLPFALPTVRAGSFYSHHCQLLLENGHHATGSALLGRLAQQCILAVFCNRHALEGLVEDQGLSPAGRYYLRLCVQGAWRFLVLDDSLPLDPDSGIPLLHYPRDHPTPQLLPTLL